MNRSTHDQELEDVLDAYLSATGTPTHEALTAWVRRYPQYERELTEFTVDWSLLRHLPPATGTASVVEATLVARGMETLRPLLGAVAQEQATSDGAEPLASLVGEAQRRGLPVSALAQRAGLSVPLVLKLDRRLIRAATLPAQVVQSVAAAIGRDLATVSSYLQGAPRLAQNASYHAGQAPTLAGQEDFADAVRGDLTLTEEQRNHLLAQRPAAE
jgi:hypothetical protein